MHLARSAFVLILTLFLAGAALAQPVERTLFDGHRVTNLGFSNYTDPASSEPGRVLHVTVPELSADPAVFVPLADRLFEEMFQAELVDSDLRHAFVIQWRLEPDDPTARRYGEDVYYARREDGSWQRTTYLEYRTGPSSYGRLEAATTHRIGDYDVELLPPRRGFSFQYNEDVLLIRCALAIDLDDVDALGAFVLAFLEWQRSNETLHQAITDNAEIGLVISMSNALPNSRFDFQRFQTFLVPGEPAE